MSTYFWINILTIIIPMIATFDKRIKFHHKWYAVWPAIIITGLFFVIWDIYFTQLQVWGFNMSHLSGFYFFNLPIEEVIFFVAIPYAIVFTYGNIKTLVQSNQQSKMIFYSTFILASILFIVAILNFDKLYTNITFLLTSIFLFLHILVFRSKYLKTFYISYAIIFILPFILVNGALTGMFTTEPIVWYNDYENLGIRVFTIPIEDFIYGMLLYLINVTIFEQIIQNKEDKKLYLKKYAIAD